MKREDIEERAVTIESQGGVRLDARLHHAPGRRLAVLCHPHPLYGGTMDNNVVLAARDGAAELGSSTLRFNFRGVGASAGTFDEGRGEREDLEACFTFARELEGEGVEVDLVAYSFGAWVAATALDAGLEPATVTLISPPADFMSFAGLRLPSLPTLVVSGDRDEFGSVASVDRWLGAQSFEVKRVVLEGVDHFYWGAERRLVSVLEEFLATDARS